MTKEEWETLPASLKVIATYLLKKCPADPADVLSAAARSRATANYKPFERMTIEELLEARKAIEVEISSRDHCEHGVACGDWCPECNLEYRAAMSSSLR